MKNKQKLSKYPLADTLKYHWRPVLKLIGCKFGENLSYYIFTVFVIAYATSVGISKGDILSAINLSAVVCIFTLLGLGYISDYVAKRTILIASSLGLIIFAIPYYYVLTISYSWLVFATVIGVSIIWASQYAVHGSFYPGLFPPEVRYTGASLGQQIAGPIAGGLAPFIATYLYGQSHNYLAVAGYLMVGGLISLVSVLSIRPHQCDEALWGAAPAENKSNQAIAQ